jgi:hypothetical protein
MNLEMNIHFITTNTPVVFNIGFFKIIIKDYFIYNNSIIKFVSILWDFIKKTFIHSFRSKASSKASSQQSAI